MMRVDLNGLTELIQALTDAPAAMREEASGIIRETTEAAAREIAQAYPEVTGTLRRRVKTEYPSSAILVGRVRSSAPHAWLYEHGVRGRKQPRLSGRGITPTVAPRHRDQMFARLVGVVRRHGFTVNGV